MDEPVSFVLYARCGFSRYYRFEEDDFGALAVWISLEFLSGVFPLSYYGIWGAVCDVRFTKLSYRVDDLAMDSEDAAAV